MKRKNTPQQISEHQPPILPMQAFLPIVLLAGLLSLIPFSSAKADTYYSYTTQSNEVIETYANINQSTYPANSAISITTAIYFTSPFPSGSYPVSLTATTNGATVTVIPTTTLNSGTQNTGYYYATPPVGTGFHTPNPQVTTGYTVDFTTTVDEGGGGNPSYAVDTYSAGQGWTNIGTPLWEASVGLNVGAQQTEVVTIEFDAYSDGLYTGRESIDVVLQPGETYAYGVSPELPSYHFYTAKGVCIANTRGWNGPSNLYVDPAYRC